MAKTKRRTKTKSKSVISPLTIGAVVLTAVLIVSGLILLGNQGGREADIDQFPALGDPDAPVTMVEYSDYG